MRGRGIITGVVCALVGLTVNPEFCRGADSTFHGKVLILSIDQPSRPFARELLGGIQDSTRQSIGISTFVEFFGPTALESPAVTAHRRKLLATRYAGQPIQVIVAVGERTLPEAEMLRNDLFPSARLIFLVSSLDWVRTKPHQGEGLFVDPSPLPSVKLAVSLTTDRRRLVVVSGTTAVDQILRKSIADSLGLRPRKIEATYLNGLPLPELLGTAVRAADESIFVITSNMVDRSGRATNNVDLAPELSAAGKVPVVEGSDLSLGYGSLGGDLAAYRLTGQEIGKRVQRILDTGQAPPGVTLDPAPRRKVLDWRQLQRFGIAESKVPADFEVLYRKPGLWEEHHDLILTVMAGLLVQTLLISILLTERRRRAEAQQRMRRQLKLETMVSKASLDLAAATHEQLSATLRDLSAGLADCLGIERVSVWMFETERHEYVRVHFWPDTETPWKVTTTFAQMFPYIHDELVAARNVVFASLAELPLSAAQDVSELRKTGMVSFLGVPLKLAEKPIGAFFIATFTHPIHWETEVISTIQVLSDILAQVISRSIAEERARRTDEQSRAMLASLPGFVLMIDGTGQILKQTNRIELAEAELPRALADAWLGKNLLELWRADGEAASQVAQALEKVIQGQKTSLALEYRYEAPRSTRWMEVRAEGLYGEQHGAVVSHTDITGRKKT